MQMVIDDIGWMIGRDMRWEEEPSRTGMPRRHVLKDYVAINELGRAIGMKLKCPLVLGEWDKDNLLRNVPHSSKFGDKWDSSLYLDKDEAARCRDYINTAEYIEIALHGLLHDVWNEGKLVGGSEYFFPEGFVKGAPEPLAPKGIIRQHLEAFMDIYRSWGFTKPIRSFVSPGGVGTGQSWKTGGLAEILADYGIKYWCNFEVGGSYVLNDIIVNDKTIMFSPWESYDLDPDALPDVPLEKIGIIGSHWPNYLRFNPDRNLDNLDAWARYFERQSERFGIILSKDIAFASYQQLYKYHAKMGLCGDNCTIDLTHADAQGAPDPLQPLYISVKNDLVPQIGSGGTLTVYETHRDFTNYRINRSGEGIIRIGLRSRSEDSLSERS